MKAILALPVSIAVVSLCVSCQRQPSQVLSAEDCRSALLEFVNESNDEMLLMSVDFLKEAVPKRNGFIVEFGAFSCNTQTKCFSIDAHPRNGDGCSYHWSGQFVKVHGKWKVVLVNALRGNSNARIIEH